MRADRIVRKSCRSRFLITLTDGAAFSGILFDADRTTLHLKDAEAVEANGERVKADSDIYLPRGRVAYLQLLD